jgi:hypothetical protein
MIFALFISIPLTFLAALVWILRPRKYLWVDRTPRPIPPGLDDKLWKKIRSVK